jgi:hypoxanthine phosphoribosyltransferase
MKVYVSPDSLRKDSYQLGSKVLQDGFKPDFMVAIWRGGATIGLCIHELMKYKGVNADHIAIRTSKYTGVDVANNKVTVHNLGYLKERLGKDSKVLLVDDIFDTGHSIEAIFDSFSSSLGDNMPTDIRVATVFYKPSRNLTSRIPNYYIHETSSWVVFSHELEGMSLDEIRIVMGDEIANIISSC